MQKQLTAIETQRDKCNTIWADVVLLQTAYEDAVDAYNDAVSPGEQVTTVEVPQPSAVSKLYLCKGPCSTPFETQVLATTSHQVFCDVLPHKGSNYSYYSCPPDYQNECPQKVFHQAPCRGGCDTLFQIDFSSNSIPKDESHRTQCDERTSRSLINLWTGNCIGRYYSCNGQTSADCPNASKHLKTEETEKGAPVVEKPVQTSSNTKKPKELLACGVHSVGTPGSHAKMYCGFCRAPTYACLRDDGHGPVRCPKASNGQTCTVDEGWQIACDAGHVCQYPSDTQPPPVVVPPKETPPTTLQPKATLQACGHVYDPGSSSAHTHRLVSCPRQNGKSCSYGSYYACTPHTHAYGSDPAPDPVPVVVQCANTNKYAGKCIYNRVVSGTDAYEHATKCAAGHPYWSCNATAVAAHSGHKSTTPTTPTTPKAPPKPVVSYHACGVHPTTVSGDHSLQASCSRDSRCISSSFYYCQHSSHTYPAPPKVPPKKPDPPEPKVVCPADSWTNCGGRVSHATTCKAGHTYYTCNPEAVSAHKWHIKAGVKCPAHAWTNCNGARSHATTCGQGHSYYTCNPEAVSAHSWHKPIVCPAHAWTNCKGAVSHAKKCGRGHTYYTCNPSAVSAHSWH